MAMSMESNKKSRFTDLCDEPIDHLLSPIKGYQDQPLLPLTETIKPISSFFNEIEDNVFVALHNCRNPVDELTQQESASVHLYTMEFGGGPSLYILLNKSLRAENREELKPWFPFLNLFLTALYKLPSQSKTVYRGVRDIDLSSQYRTGEKFAWWGVSSCTTDIDVLESNAFFGKHGQRTLFAIECINGKSITHHSYYKNTEKEIILMPGSYFEIIGQLDLGSQLHMIQLKELTPPITLLKPPFSKSNNMNNVASVVENQNTSIKRLRMLLSKIISSNFSSQEKEFITKKNDYLTEIDHATGQLQLNILLIGAPRVGKSQLINALCNEENFATTSPSLNSCAKKPVECYVLEDNQQQTPGINPFRINFYDISIIKSWNDQHDLKIILEFIEETDPVCLIYCASPRSFGDLKQVRLILELCKEKQICCALVCTNMWTSVNRHIVMQEFEKELMFFGDREEKQFKQNYDQSFHKVIHFGNGALCTMVNSKEYYDPDIPIRMPVQGIDELMHCIVEALDSDKLLGLCKAVLNRRTLKEKIIQKIGFPFSTYWTSS